MSHLIQSNLITNRQLVFIKGTSTTTAVVSFIEEIIDHLENGNVVSGIFLGFIKAVDSLEHDLIIYKFEALEVNGKAKAWSESYLTGRSQIVEVKSMKKESYTW